MKKRIFAMLLAVVMVLGTVAGAAGTEKAITVTPMDMTINGQSVTPAKSDGSPAEVFAYDGATYVPLRYLSELLGITVEWDKDAPNTAKLVMDEVTYTATVPGMHGPMTVATTLTADNKIAKVEVVDNVETPGLVDWPARVIPERIVENQSLAVDTVTGVTISSRAIINGVETALKNAGVDVAPFKTPIEKEKAQDVEYTADVIIVGGGGAGVAAAVGATEAGASVIVIEKTGFLGGNSIVAGGIYNCPDSEEQDYAKFSGDPDSLVENALAEEPVSKEHKALQDAVRKEFEVYKKSDRTFFDSPNWFALQTWNGGDKIGSLAHLKVFADNAYPTLEWLESMGMTFQEGVSLGGGALYPRTHTPTSPNGTGYFKVFEGILDERTDLCTLLMETEGKSLITSGGKVVGVNAVGKDGNKVTLHANKGVILATGGFAGNVELRQEYCQGEKWPDLGAGLISSNMPGVTGDGIFMAEAAGAELINMDQIQLLPYCDPNIGATFNIVNSCQCFINKEGNRFVREDGRRDEMSKGIIDQTDGMMFMVSSTDDPSTRMSLGGMSLQYYIDNNLYGYMIAENLTDLAKQMGVPADALEASIADYNAHVESGEKDQFGRTTYSTKVEGKYYFAYPRKPAAHHTMGGVNVDTETRALRSDGSVIKGLYCAGEITGNLHGGNRLGGNAIVDFCVFGRIAGTNAAAGK
ncbi:MAG: FAD-dependent oxidoreductase [Oscillospiraceae bacterium]|jgi:urocanate reductase|nr:FAD-dependent oxidoreductase [Oscillospiraceae bacterium]